MVIKIDTLHFNDYEDLACKIAETYDEARNTDEYNSVDVIAKYNAAKEILRELICLGYDIALITDFSDPEWDNYNDAFVIGLCDGQIWCEPVKRENGYISIESSVVYLFGDCNSKIIPRIESEEVFEVSIGDEDCDCEQCGWHWLDTVPTITYKVDGQEVSEKEYYNKLAKIEQKYGENIRSMLFDYCEFMDEMNEFRHLFEW